MILIPGNSGCSVEIVSDNNLTKVKKSTYNKDYVPRLKKQFEKQIFYRDILGKFDNISTPEIFSANHGEEYFSFLMEHKRFLDCLTFLSTSGKYEIDRFFNSINSFIEYEIHNSKTEEDILQKFIFKYSDTMAGINNQSTLPKDITKKIDKIIYSVSEMKVPVGICHGDLTLSNILTSKNTKEISLIDFLDNFVETPLQDMVKIRQDTKFLWTTFISNSRFDTTRNEIVMKYLDNKFNQSFNQYDFYTSYYKPFQILNILRIFRYTSDRRILDYLVRCLGCIT